MTKYIKGFVFPKNMNLIDSPLLFLSNSFRIFPEMKNISQIYKCFTKHLASKKQISDVFPADVKATNIALIKHCKHSKISTSDLSSCILSLLVGYIIDHLTKQ